MIDHDAARALAAAALDFDLSIEDDERLLAHMIECESCRAFAEAIDADARAIAGLATEDAPIALKSRILDAIPVTVAEPADTVLPAAPRTRSTRPSLLSIPKRYRGPVALTAAAAIIVALIGGGLVWRPGPIGAPGIAGGSPSAPGQTGPTGSGAPGSSPIPTVEPGSRLAASPWTQVADLTADVIEGGVVALGSGFRLTTLDGTPAVEAARRLTVHPPIAFSTTADPDGKSVHITPTEPLIPGAAYRFSLKAADGHEVGTWAFQAHQPLRVIGSVPSDTATDVPLDTGIEVTFDQDGVIDPADHVTISPSIPGRFEVHGRTLAFVPDQRLAPATIYTVTVTPGIAVGSTGERLEEGVTFRFETTAEGAVDPRTTFQFSDELFETATNERPIIAVWTFQDSDDEQAPPPPTSAPIEVYRLDGIDAAMEVYRGIRAYPRWSRHSSVDLVPTAGLTRIMALDARLQDSQGVLWTELPERLPAGWYLIHLASPTRPIQTMLQVTDIASYLVVSDTKTLLWTNDLTTGGPLAGAIAASSGTELGTTGTDGTLVMTTPGSVVPEPAGTCVDPCVAFITVRDGDRSAFVPASEPSDPEGKGYGRGTPGDEGLRYWHAFDTDRSLYRTSDVVNTWGVIRDRDTGQVPANVTIGLAALEQDTGNGGPLLTTTTVRPNEIGAFASSIALTGLPEGFYRLELRIADRLVATTGFQVDRILKPAYRLDVVTGRRVYVEGDQIRVTARATFYEGTPVPGVKLRTEGIVDASFTTDATGTATRRTIARHGDADDEEPTGEAQVRSLTVTPASAEEGEIASTGREIVVFPSHWTVSGDATIRDGRVRAAGTLSEIARDRLEREVSSGADPWSLDPAGKALAGRTVTLTFFDVTTVRVQRGTRYDFIEKKVVPTYEYDTKERVADTIRVKTDKKGRFSASIRAADGHAYRVRATATDTDRHVARRVVWANEPYELIRDDITPRLSLTADPDKTSGEFGVGDAIDLKLTDPAAVGEAASDRFLFYTAQRGLRDVVVQESSRFRTTFGRSAPPNLQIDGVRFNGSRYSATTTFDAMFRATDRALTVALSTDAARYAPGADVRLQVTTRDRSGDPVAATVVLRAVDEKLFTLGGAAAADPLGELYAGVDPGIRVTYRSHRLPRPDSDNGGGDTGGGGRDDFRDSLLFESVDTGSDGRATVTIHLSDDLTSWRVSASAIGAELQAGEGSLLVPVGLPFFVDATIAPEYLVSDRPEIGLRAFGTALEASSRVTFGVDSTSLGLHVEGLTGDAFATVRVPLPALELGRHEITVTARTGSGSSAREDRLTRTFTVIGSRLERTRTTHREIDATSHIEGGGGLTEVTVADVGVGRYAPLLLGLADPDSGRLENVLAGAVAKSLAESRFANRARTDVDVFDRRVYQVPDGGLSVVPYASSDLEASVLAALVAPERFDVSRLSSYLTTIAADEKETRERRTFALAGLAGLGSSVLPEIRAAAAEPDLTIRERLLLGLGAAAIGDAATAHAIGGSLIDGYGEALGDQARLRVGTDTADVTQATALMAMLAAANGDPLAPRFWAYVETNPDPHATYALHAVGFVIRMLDHASPSAASFAYTIGGVRTVVALEPGQAFHVTVLGSQLPAFTIEPIEGKVSATTSWREPVDPATFTVDPDLTVVRTVTPAGVIGSSKLVTVDLEVDLSLLSNMGCHTVTDFVPSGLVPVSSLRGWVDDPEDTERVARNATSPYAQVGQRVYFCAEPRPDGGIVRLRYVARVISAGTYTWETSIAQSPFATDRAALSGATKVSID